MVVRRAPVARPAGRVLAARRVVERAAVVRRAAGLRAAVVARVVVERRVVLAARAAGLRVVAVRRAAGFAAAVRAEAVRRAAGFAAERVVRVVVRAAAAVARPVLVFCICISSCLSFRADDKPHTWYCKPKVQLKNRSWSSNLHFGVVIHVKQQRFKRTIDVSSSCKCARATIRNMSVLTITKH